MNVISARTMVTMRNHNQTHTEIKTSCYSIFADFINQGSLEQHLRRMRSLYDQRRQTLIQALTDNFGDQITIIGENAGIHLMIRISTDLSDTEIVQKAAQQGVSLFSASMYYWNQPNSGEFVLGYSSLSPQQIRQGVRRLRQVFEKP